MKQDFVDEMIAERSRTIPDMSRRVDALVRARRLIRELADLRQVLNLSQTEVAAQMGVSQSSLARLEAGEADPRISTIERYVQALGLELTLQPTTPTARPARKPPSTALRPSAA